MMNGWRTYLAAAGLLGKALYEFQQGQINEAMNDLLAALAVFGLRSAVSGLTAGGAKATGN